MSTLYVLLYVFHYLHQIKFTYNFLYKPIPLSGHLLNLALGQFWQVYHKNYWHWRWFYFMQFTYIIISTKIWGMFTKDQRSRNNSKIKKCLLCSTFHAFHIWWPHSHCFGFELVSYEYRWELMWTIGVVMSCTVGL